MYSIEDWSSIEDCERVYTSSCKYLYHKDLQAQIRYQIRPSGVIEESKVKFLAGVLKNSIFLYQL